MALALIAAVISEVEVSVPPPCCCGGPLSTGRWWVSSRSVIDVPLVSACQPFLASAVKTN